MNRFFLLIMSIGLMADIGYATWERQGIWDAPKLEKVATANQLQALKDARMRVLEIENSIKERQPTEFEMIEITRIRESLSNTVVKAHSEKGKIVIAFSNFDDFSSARAFQNGTEAIVETKDGTIRIFVDLDTYKWQAHIRIYRQYRLPTLHYSEMAREEMVIPLDGGIKEQRDNFEPDALNKITNISIHSSSNSHIFTYTVDPYHGGEYDPTWGWW